MLEGSDTPVLVDFYATVRPYTGKRVMCYFFPFWVLGVSRCTLHGGVRTAACWEVFHMAHGGGAVPL